MAYGSFTTVMITNQAFPNTVSDPAPNSPSTLIPTLTARYQMMMLLVVFQLVFQLLETVIPALQAEVRPPI